MINHKYDFAGRNDARLYDLPFPASYRQRMKNLILIPLFIFSFNTLAAIEVIMTTNKGEIQIELDEVNAPISTANFLTYVDAGFFNGTIFHRVIKNFVIQGGGHLPDMTMKPTNAPIENEAMNGLSNLAGSLGMARDEEWNSATSQFYINTVDNVRLDKRYAVFARVTKGMDVVKLIEASATHSMGEHDDVPILPIVVEEVRRK